MSYKDMVKKIESNVQNTFFIHYSCQSLSDNNEGYSPRITSIAVLHCNSAQMHSFSMHLCAEEMGIKRNQISEHYDEIEAELLTQFATFLQQNQTGSYWIHWNMTNVNFGFDALNHRYKVLTKKDLPVIPEANKFNLSSLFAKKYGSKFAEDPKLLSLMELNGSRHRDFLTGEEEVQAFEKNEFVKLHNSTICKVRFFRIAYNLSLKNSLRTKTNRLGYWISQLYQHPAVQLISMFGTILGIVLGVRTLIS